MLSFAPDYDHLPLVAKVEVFEYALHSTEGNDLARVSFIRELCLHIAKGEPWHKDKVFIVPLWVQSLGKALPYDL